MCIESEFRQEAETKKKHPWGKTTINISNEIISNKFKSLVDATLPREKAGYYNTPISPNCSILRSITCLVTETRNMENQKAGVIWDGTEIYKREKLYRKGAF